MSKPASNSFDQIKHKISETVASGQEVRQRVQRQVTEILHHIELDAEGCQHLASSVLEGAQDGIREVTEEKKASRLRDVIDGLADGFGACAQSVKLTVEEARASGQHFAETDLKQASENLKSLAGLLKGALDETVQKMAKELGQQWDHIKAHAHHAWDRTKPGIDAALQTIAADPIGTGKEALQSGVKAATKATGALFSEIGRRLDSLGNKMRS